MSEHRISLFSPIARYANWIVDLWGGIHGARPRAWLTVECEVLQPFTARSGAI